MFVFYQLHLTFYNQKGIVHISGILTLQDLEVSGSKLALLWDRKLIIYIFYLNKSKLICLCLTFKLHVWTSWTNENNGNKCFQTSKKFALRFLFVTMHLKQPWYLIFLILNTALHLTLLLVGVRIHNYYWGEGSIRTRTIFQILGPLKIFVLFIFNDV